MIDGPNKNSSALKQMPGAVLHDTAEIAERAVRLAISGEMLTVDGGVLKTTAQSLCIHGDTPDAVLTRPSHLSLARLIGGP